MPTIQFEGTAYTLRDGESILDCLQRGGANVASSCRAGVCLSCMLRVEDGEVPEAAQKGLKATLRTQGYFLSCQWSPAQDLGILRGEEGGRTFPANIESIVPLNGRVIRVRLRPKTMPAYFAGQFANLIHPGGQVRSYSLASVPGKDAYLELHVGLIPGGLVSGWLHREARAGDIVHLSGPHGGCFYVPEDLNQPLFLLGTGTGLAPLYGIARDALRQEHAGPIHLFHGGLNLGGLYLADALRRLSADYPNFHYHPCILEGEAQDSIKVGDVGELALNTLPDLNGYRVFLCGPPDLVKQMQRKTFLAGASLQAIFADAFLPAAAQPAR